MAAPQASSCLRKAGEKGEEDKEVSEFCDYTRLCTPQAVGFNLFPLLKTKFCRWLSSRLL